MLKLPSRPLQRFVLGISKFVVFQDVSTDTVLKYIKKGVSALSIEVLDGKTSYFYAHHVVTYQCKEQVMNNAFWPQQ